MVTMMKDAVILRDLGDGLILRRSTAQDAPELAEFNARIHSDDGPDAPDQRVAAWTRDLLERPHPTFDEGDFTIVVDSASGRIVSSMNLISQTWSYAGIPFGVGRPELVGTLPEYRKRGLVRLQFEVIHGWSAERGEVLQAITGIPYYYRQFGYEMALDLDTGRFGYKMHVPPLPDGQVEPYRIRPAVEADLPFLIDLYQDACRRSLVSCVRDEATWRYELNGTSLENVYHWEWRVIETPQGSRVGYLAHLPFNWSKGATLVATAYEISPGTSWGAVTPGVIRYLAATGKVYSQRQGEREFDSFGFWLGSQHPVYDVVHERTPRIHRPYAWYIRLPDHPGFLRLIQPVLEDRLAASAFAGHTGALRLTFYRRGLKLVFDHGRLEDLRPWNPEPQGYSGDAAFPDLTFLQLLFGYRSLEELDYAFPDCWWDGDEAYGLLKALFPKQPSHIWGLT